MTNEELQDLVQRQQKQINLLTEIVQGPKKQPSRMEQERQKMIAKQKLSEAE